MAVQPHAISFVQGLGDVWLYPFWEWSRWLMDIVSCLLLYPRSSNHKDWSQCRCALKMLSFNWPADGGCGCIEIYKKISLGYFAVWHQQPRPDDFIGSITSFRSDGRKKTLIMAITRAKKENYADCPTPRSEVIHQWGCGIKVTLTPHSSYPVSKHKDSKGENNSSLTTRQQYGSCLHFLQSQCVAQFPKNKLTLSRSDNASHMDTFLLCTTCKKGQLRIASQPDSPNIVWSPFVKTSMEIYPRQKGMHLH